MFKCFNCGADLPDGSNVCPNCRAVQDGANNVYSQIPNTPHGMNYSEFQPNSMPHPRYSPEEQRFLYQQRLIEAMKDASNAKVFGIISIICAIVPSLLILGWIFGAIGITKANSAVAIAQQVQDYALLAEANSSKSLSKAGLIVSGIVTFLGIVAYVLFLIGIFSIPSFF